MVHAQAGTIAISPAIWRIMNRCSSGQHATPARFAKGLGHTHFGHWTAPTCRFRKSPASSAARRAALGQPQSWRWT